MYSERPSLATVIGRYVVATLSISTSAWLIARFSGEKTAIRVIVLVIFNTPIVAISVTLPFVASLRVALREKGVPGAIESTSYSRITGLFGAVVLTAFFWAIGNVVIWYLFESPAQVGSIIDGIWRFFVLGSALFLPYAFNQLRGIMADRQKHIEETERLHLASSVTRPGAPGVTVLANRP